jgi:HK97 family phage major capsid protein
MTDTLLAFGGAIKALGDGKVAGYLVRYTDADTPDLSGDYFPGGGACDFDAEDGDRVTVYYGHGFDPVLKHRKLGKGTLRFDDVGVWVEAQLQMRDEYERAIYGLAEAGKLGWSSGTLPNLVEREDEGKAHRITHWPLGKDASLTPTPAAGLVATQVLPLKAWLQAQDVEVPESALYADPDETQEMVITDTADAEPDPETTPVVVVVEAEAKAVDDTATVETTDEAGDTPAEDVETMSEQNFEALAADIAEIKAALSKPVNPVVPVAAPAVLTMGLGDTEAKALAAWYKRGDIGGVKHMLESDGSISLAGLKASNNTDMNIGTAADGGDLVPTGHYQGIIARRNEGMLTSSLRIMAIPGKGTTVNVPVDNEADGEFVSTNEAATYDTDAPAVAKVAMTLVKYTKQIQLSVELLEDEDSQLMAFLNDFVGRGLAKTHNSLLLTEAANGTKLADFDATAIAAGKLETMVGNTVLDPYLDDSGSVAWVMQPSTKWAINAVLGNARIYAGAENVPARRGGDLLGYPVYTSAKAPALATGTKSVFFGNWAYMGFREAPGLTVLRDPYTLAASGQIRLVYAFRTVYKVLQATAIGYGLHA